MVLNRLVIVICMAMAFYVANAQDNNNAMPVQQAQQISRAANKVPIKVAAGAAKPGKGILGKIKINGAIYEAVCDCSRDALTKAANKLKKEKEPVKCRLPSKYRIFFQKSATPVDPKNTLSSAQLLEFLPKPSTLQFVDIKKRTLGDVDGRQQGHVVGALGGELGEFILAFSVYNRILGHQTTDPYNAEKYLRAWVKETMATRSFALHWDMGATEQLKANIEVETNFPLNEAPETLRKKILGLECKVEPCGLAKHENIGIDHIKYMMIDADRQASQMNNQRGGNGYMVPKPLIVDSVRAAFKILWDGDSPLKMAMKWSSLPQVTSTEKAFVMLNVASGCRAKGFVPAVPVKNTQSSIFAYHPDAVSIRREQLCAFFERMDTSGHVKKDAMCRQVERQGNLHLSLSARTISKGMPVYSVNIL
jgi:hypothetical protein